VFHLFSTARVERLGGDTLAVNLISPGPDLNSYETTVRTPRRAWSFNVPYWIQLDALEQAESSHADGILQSIANAEVTHSGHEDAHYAQRRCRAHRDDLYALPGTGCFVRSKTVVVLPLGTVGAEIEAKNALWILPIDPASKDRAWYLKLQGGGLRAKMTDSGLTVTIDREALHSPVPRCVRTAIHSVAVFLSILREGRNSKTRSLLFIGERCCRRWWKRRWLRSFLITTDMF